MDLLVLWRPWNFWHHPYWLFPSRISWSFAYTTLRKNASQKEPYVAQRLNYRKVAKIAHFSVSFLILQNYPRLLEASDSDPPSTAVTIRFHGSHQSDRGCMRKLSNIVKCVHIPSAKSSSPKCDKKTIVSHPQPSMVYKPSPAPLLHYQSTIRTNPIVYNRAHRHL